MSSMRYLRKCAFKAMLRDAEKENIERSVRTVKVRLRKHFTNAVGRIRVFGSFSRGTLLPRKIDVRSDVDLMVIFKDKDSAPQTYLNRLKKFAVSNYSSSEIYQSNPTIVLCLNHINIEIVPAVNKVLPGFQIPAPASDFIEWIETDPVQFNIELKEKNKQTKSKMKPLIRLAKYWNATQGYIYPSYELEQRLVSHWYFGEKNLRDYFYAGILSLELPWQAAMWKKEKLDRTKRIIESAMEEEQCGNQELSELKIRKLLPEFW